MLAVIPKAEHVTVRKDVMHSLVKTRAGIEGAMRALDLHNTAAQ